MKFNKRKCNCDLCKRGRKVYAIAAKLPAKDSKWLLRFYNFIIDVECEMEMAEACPKRLQIATETLTQISKLNGRAKRLATA